MKKKEKKEYSQVVRDLMATIEFMRSTCEHAEGRTKEDKRRLSIARSVGMRVNAWYMYEVPDYQMDSFWKDVVKIQNFVGRHDEAPKH
jgi:hypothetical protein